MKQDGKFVLMNRKEFQTWLDKKQITREINVIQQHHTWKPDYSDFNGSNHFTLLKGMESAHLKRGFSEIAQNITIFPDGMIAVCRDINIAPAGIKGSNAHGVCIETLGNFDVGGDTMSAEQKQSVLSVTALLCVKFKLEPNIVTVTYHSFWDLETGERIFDNRAGHTTKSCPGTNWFGGNLAMDARDKFIPSVKQTISTLFIQEVINMFVDIQNLSTESQEAINKLVEFGVIKGKSDKEFDPKSNVTREQLAVVLHRALKKFGLIK